MKSMRLLLCLFIVQIAMPAKADKIDKAFESLNIYNYFDAKEKFEKKLKKVPSPSAYGLAVIYFRQDNPFHNIDSAYRLIRVAEVSFDGMKDKQKQKYVVHGFTISSILALKEKISTYYFNQLTTSSSSAIWSNFLERNPDALEKKRATFIRDSLELEAAKIKNTSVAFDQFRNKYPNSELIDDAVAGFNVAQYKEETKAGNVAAYVNFMQKFPASPYVNQAQDDIYKLMTEPNTVEALNLFITQHPSNRNKEEAWRRLYQVYMYEYSDERIEKFQREFPNYPFTKELKSDLQMARLILFPCQVGKKYGAMDTQGNLIIPTDYESLSLFSEGLSLASKNGKFGFINKANTVVIPFQYNSAYDFEQGRALVELTDKFGLIDRTGKTILPIEFEDIGTFSEGLIYAQKNGKYAYYDKFGQVRIPALFDEAFSFVDGLAKVQVGDKQAFINSLGQYYFPPKYSSINFFTNELLIFEEEDYYGLIDLKQNIVLPAKYDAIGFLSDGMAIIELDSDMGYIDAKGTVVIPPKFETFANSNEIAQFVDGMAIAKLKGKMGIIDKTGKFVVKNTFTQLGKESSLIAFNKGKLWGFIDPTGKVKIPPVYLWAESFEKGTAIVAKEDKQGVIAMDNTELIPIAFDEITRIEKGYFLLEKAEKFGLANESGKIVVPAEYKEIRQLNDTIFVLVMEQGLEYLYLPDNSIVQKK